MKYVFFGTPEFAAIILKKLAEKKIPPALLVCNPDKPVGRKKIITPPPAKVVAQKYGLEIAQPENLGGWLMENGKWSKRLSNMEFAIVAAYAKIIPQSVLDLFPKGVIGVHPSLLPKYRGATPIQSAILNGDAATGATLYMLDKEVDHGPIIAQRKVLIDEHDNFGILTKKLGALGGEMLCDTLLPWYDGKIMAVNQNHEMATLTKKFMTEDGLVDLRKDEPLVIYRKIKALNPEPGVYTFIEKNKKRIRVKLLEANFLENKLVVTAVQEEGGRVNRDETYIRTILG